MSKNTLDNDTRDELMTLTPVELKQRIYLSNKAMQEVQEELEANPEYQALKENLKALSSGKREVFARQRAIIKYALELINLAPI